MFQPPYYLDYNITYNETSDSYNNLTPLTLNENSFLNLMN